MSSPLASLTPLLGSQVVEIRQKLDPQRRLVVVTALVFAGQLGRDVRDLDRCRVEEQDADGVEAVCLLQDLRRLGRSGHTGVVDLKAISLENLKEYPHRRILAVGEKARLTSELDGQVSG
ncbi:hypothetical protein [Rhizobium sp. Leaf383]|uniref:hypothetical protein n=1 Tax=Rhizobium sp. Leaf383 TaxID=1736357 RepID=UPI00138F162F|nr:hypothetical protein [Rhizobium sp. Leaf383]